jgi:hypothetical protein
MERRLIKARATVQFKPCKFWTAAKYDEAVEITKNFCYFIVLYIFPVRIAHTQVTRNL